MGSGFDGLAAEEGEGAAAGSRKEQSRGNQDWIGASLIFDI